MGGYNMTDDFEGKASSFSGTKLNPSSSDDGVASLTLPFSFPFYGENYNTVYVSTDGSVLFNNKFQYIRSASELIGFKAISVLGADYMFNSGDQISVKMDENSATIRWETSNMYQKAGVYFDFQVKLLKNGEIECYYSSISDGVDNMVIGISDGNGKNTISDISNTTNIPGNYKLKYYPPGLPAGMNFSPAGFLSGTPLEAEKEWPLKVTVTDSYNTNVTKEFVFSTKTNSINDTENMTVSLKQNYPNPFNPVTTINYSVGVSLVGTQGLPLQLSVYNANGQLVKTLVDGKKKAGSYSVKFDGSDLNSGIYFYKLKAGNNILTNKMILIK